MTPNALNILFMSKITCVLPYMPYLGKCKCNSPFSAAPSAGSVNNENMTSAERNEQNVFVPFMFVQYYLFIQF